MRTLRGTILAYARLKLGMLEPEALDNGRLAVACGLCLKPPSRKQAFRLLARFAESDEVVRALTADKAKRRAASSSDGTTFYKSRAWRELRYRVLVKADGRCQCCGTKAVDGGRLHVDHIKPRSKYPELALEESNLQVLCEDCNMGKSNRDETDWRADEWSEYRIGQVLRAL